MRRSIIVVILFLLCLNGIASGAEKTGVDIRVLIDISGSMRQNDPQNLRRPALRMLVGLMQPGTRAGVWTFARWVNMLVPHGDVNNKWKKRAKALSKQIGSPGQFTNIEDVLDQASRSWSADPDAANRHIVLLTDGMVDVSKKPAKNQASRDRIISDLLPRIKKAGARIHAIALSDRADHALMRELAVATDGWYQQVGTADELQRVFLKIFDKVGQPEGVPLEGNKFQVDSSIREATVLVFRDPDSPQTRLHAPDGQAFERSDFPNGIAWHADQGYDLITIADPIPGEWRLEADVDPDNRVMIVTDLKLDTSVLPNRLAVNERVAFSAQLTNKGKIINRRAFLDLVQLNVNSQSSAGNETHPINDQGKGGDETAGDGRFSMQFGSGLPSGEVSLRVSTESATFVREKRLVVNVVEPAVLEVSGPSDKPFAKLIVDKTVIQRLNSAVIYQQDLQGNRAPLEPSATDKNQWQADLLNTAWPVKVELEATTMAGNLLQTTLGPVYVDGMAPPAPAPQRADVESGSVASAQPGAPVEPAPTEDEEASSWVMPAIVFGGMNVLLVVGGGLTWWMVRRRRSGEPEEVTLVSDDELTELVDIASDSHEEAA